MKPGLTRAKDLWEYDVVTGWRHRMIWKPGEVHDIKKGMSRRERRTARHLIRVGRLERL